SGTGRDIAGVQVLVDERGGAVTDTGGQYRIRAVHTGWHRVAARLIGYRGVVLDSVLVRAGATVTADFLLEASAVELAPLVVTAPLDELLDPLATRSEQKISAADLRELPVSSLEEAIALSAGTVGQSYRGGRIGEESFIVDGLGVKNQLDAASGALGLRLPPDLLGEASLVTNGFSARYGQALSGLVNVVTRDPGETWDGRAAVETDRPLGGALDHGLDRIAVRAGGPIAGGVGLVAAVDGAGRLDDDPVNAPAPRIRATPAPALISCRTTAASSGTVPRSCWCPSRAGRCSGSSASTPRINGCCTTRPTNTRSPSHPPNACGATSSPATCSFGPARRPASPSSWICAQAGSCASSCGASSTARWITPSARSPARGFTSWENSKPARSSHPMIRSPAWSSPG
ncbi:MAG: TonB-dependent receptor, partial [Gemmatimonadota bacterium]|nr:TonB-dependent receptor [Gemmatimonadota bacterium]